MSEKTAMAKPRAARPRVSASKAARIGAASDIAAAPRGKGRAIGLQKGRQSTRDEIVEKKHSIVRKEIVTAAVELFANRGYRAVTMEDIAAELEYTKSVVYYYFKNKNDLLWNIFRDFVDLYSADIAAVRKQDLPCREAFSKMVYRHAMNVMTNPAGAAVYHREESELTQQQRSVLSKIKRDYDAVLEALFQQGISEGIFRDVPPHVAVSGILGMCNSLYAWYNPMGALTAEDIANHYATLLSEGYLGQG